MTPANRPPVDMMIGDVEVSSRPLPYEKAEDIQADILQIVTRTTAALTQSLGAQGLAKLIASGKEDILKLLPQLLPTLTSVADQFAAPRDGVSTLKRLAPLVMATTTVIAVNEEGQKDRFELGKAGERAHFFDLYPQTYYPVLFHAGRVTFQRFFPAGVLTGSASSTAKVA